jgi:RNA polymerase primary sigma factor
MPIEPMQEKVVSYSKYGIERFLRLYRGKGLSLDDRISHYQMNQLVTTGRLPKKTASREKRFTMREIMADLVAGYEAEREEIFPNKILSKYGVNREELEELIEENQAPALRIVEIQPEEYRVLEDMHQYLRDIDPRNFRKPGESLLLSREEEAELGRRIRKGDMKARNTLVNLSLRLVVSVAKEYRYLGVDLMDLIEWGNVGLVRAAEKFDPDYKVKFSTYAVWWIKQSIRRELTDHKKCMHIPPYLVEHVGKMKESVKTYFAKYGRTPAIERLSEEIGLPIRLAERVKEVYEAHFKASRLQIPAESVIGSYNQKREFENIVKLDLVMDAYDKLSYKEKDIIKHYFGLFGLEPKTLKETGRVIGITRERVRQIKRRALNKIRKRLGIPEVPAR